MQTSRTAWIYPGYSNYFLTGCAAQGLKPLISKGFSTLKMADFTSFSQLFVKWDPLLRIFWPKWNPCLRIFSEKVTHLGSTSPYALTCECSPIPRFPYHINKPSLVSIRIQLFKWDHVHIFSLSYNLTLEDLWPWYVTFDLINKWGFPCCIYDQTLVEIHQSMWKVEPNVNPIYNNNNRQWTTDNRGQIDHYVSFMLAIYFSVPHTRIGTA